MAELEQLATKTLGWQDEAHQAQGKTREVIRHVGGTSDVIMEVANHSRQLLQQMEATSHAANDNLAIATRLFELSSDLQESTSTLREIVGAYRRE